MLTDALAAAQPGPTPGWVTVIVVIVAALGGASGIIALLTIGLQRRKMQSDTHKTDSEASGNFVNQGLVVSKAALDQMQAAIAQSGRDSTRALELAQKNDTLEHRVDELEADLHEWSQIAKDHQAWDTLVIEELTRLNGGRNTVPPPPPLYPRGRPRPA